MKNFANLLASSRSNKKPVSNALEFSSFVCNYIFIHLVALARRQRRDFSVFQENYLMRTRRLSHTVEASHCLFLTAIVQMVERWGSDRNVTDFWFDSRTGNASLCISNKHYRHIFDGVKHSLCDGPT